MARQEDTCWSGEAAWDYRSARRNGRRGIHAGRAAGPGGGDQPPAAAVIGEARVFVQAGPDLDHLADEGGSLGGEGSRRVGAGIAAVS